MRKILIATALIAGTAPAVAQETQAGPPAEKIRQVIVYGNDPCPKSEGDEILVCARQDEKERYRIPENLRGEQPPGSTANEAWTNRVKSIEYVGRSGTESCSPVGAGGFTGCFNQIAAAAKAERKQMGDASWADLVAAERAKRLSTIDEDSEEIEARVKAEEKAKAEAATDAGSVEQK
ncbi:MAG: hypothetical protein AB7U35_09295 [Sphingobium sp.]